MFKTIIFSLKKSKILSKIRKYKERNSHFSPERIMDIALGKKEDEYQILLDNLLDLLSKDKATQMLLSEYNADLSDLKEIVGCLESTGAGQIVREYYVPFSSIAFIDTLQPLLSVWNKDGFDIEGYDRKNSNLMVMSKMLDSF